MRRNLIKLVGLALLAGVSAAQAQEAQTEGEQPKKKSLPRMGLSPAEPQLRSAPPSIPFGVDPKTSQEFVLDFHGYLLLPLNVGILEREDPGPGQSDTTLHNPPTIPQDLRRFNYTGLVPDPWVQLNFTYGNSTIAATTVLASRSITNAAGIPNPVDQLGVNDAYLTLNLEESAQLPLQLRVGAMTGRYGVMGMYDAGRYGTPLMARTNVIGETLTASLDLGSDTALILEQGIGGQLGRPRQGIVPAAWNDFADTDVGASFVNHVHAALGHGGWGQLGAHYFTAWSQDDQVSTGTIPDGNISVFGVDGRLTLERFGHLYLGYAYTKATDAASVAGVIEILNARGGPELIEEYLGPNSGGDGSLSTFGWQYDFSVARAMYGEKYTGESPDILLSLFGMATSVGSDDDDFDGTSKVKIGAEANYNMLSWFGAGMRFDHVRPDSDDSAQAFSAYSPRVFFHTDWLSQDEFALQYTYYVYGSDVVVRSGNPPEDDPTLSPDRSVISFSGTFWW